MTSDDLEIAAGELVALYRQVVRLAQPEEGIAAGHSLGSALAALERARWSITARDVARDALAEARTILTEIGREPTPGAPPS